MTIETFENLREITCDGCPTAYPNTYVAEDFDVMVADAKAAGWLVTRRAGKWLHFCPACKPAQLRTTRQGSLL